MIQRDLVNRHVYVRRKDADIEKYQADRRRLAAL